MNWNGLINWLDVMLMIIMLTSWLRRYNKADNIEQNRWKLIGLKSIHYGVISSISSNTL